MLIEKGLRHYKNTVLGIGNRPIPQRSLFSGFPVFFLGERFCQPSPTDCKHPLLTRDMNPFVDADLEKLLTHLGKISKNVCNLLTSREGG